MHHDLRRQLAAISAGALLCASFSLGCEAPTAGDTRDERVDSAKLGSTKSELFALTTSLWTDSTKIPVCWEAAGFTQEKAWVANAVQSSWEVASASIHFVGWDTCTSASKGIRIVINSFDRDGPHVVTFGKQLDGVRNGMTLDFAFSSGTFPPCTRSEAMRERCIRAIATHEFGHAIGFLHEQERGDTPTSCPDRNVVPEDATTKRLGAWDLMSIMNYCYPDRDNVFPTMLSPEDIAGTRQMYPPPTPVEAPSTPASTDTPRDPSPSTGTQSTSTEAQDPAAAEQDKEESAPAPAKRAKKSGALAPTENAGCSAAPGGVRTGGATWLVALAACVVALRRRARPAARRL